MMNSANTTPTHPYWGHHETFKQHKSNLLRIHTNHTPNLN